MPTALIRFTFTDIEKALLVAERMRQLRRGLDVITELPPSGQPGLAILLPLTDELGQAAYLQRLDDAVRNDGHCGMAGLAKRRAG